MSSRIAHRPRFRALPPQAFTRFPAQAYKKYYLARWTYRPQHSTYEKHPLGYGLTRIPYGIKHLFLFSR
ncbi:hypothetical protein EI42_02470 [Thermosporothrix hazakensis]|jgi:hypothetical protein|uniref:Uncharacterized protein n=2 Tax=Thermosporothrix TaxID=768650 RepID=A0A326U7Z5_THEHA|nr:hypothetical protein [Thermosporothrix hazakensis]PZW30499.1 hypothetical protein EI42_02470 [Thermosporothrix hazakensis]BBH91213.1 hypothetical protein KTC_59640 [Thermosporothrix sp. COM3]GCE49359.1 hypothetical protein KTH_42280 [Thermosporothrix hazakensis]